MGCDEIRDHVEGDPPPDGAEDVAREVLHTAEETDRVINLGEVLEEKHY